MYLQLISFSGNLRNLNNFGNRNPGKPGTGGAGFTCTFGTGGCFGAWPILLRVVPSSHGVMANLAGPPRSRPRPPSTRRCKQPDRHVTGTWRSMVTAQLLQHFTNFLELWPSCGEENEIPGHRRIATAIAAIAIRGDLQLSRSGIAPVAKYPASSMALLHLSLPPSKHRQRQKRSKELTRNDTSATVHHRKKTLDQHMQAFKQDVTNIYKHQIWTTRQDLARLGRGNSINSLGHVRTRSVADCGCGCTSSCSSSSPPIQPFVRNYSFKQSVQMTLGIPVHLNPFCLLAFHRACRSPGGEKLRRLRII